MIFNQKKQQNNTISPIVSPQPLLEHDGKSSRHLLVYVLSWLQSLRTAFHKMIRLVNNPRSLQDYNNDTHWNCSGTLFFWVKKNS